MRITRIELRHTKMELVSPFETSLGVERFEEHIIVRVDGDGLTGWGECVVEPTPSYSYKTLQTAWHVLKDFLIPGILGKEFDCVGSALAVNGWVRGHRMARAGLEAALTDAFARAAGVSRRTFFRYCESKEDVMVERNDRFDELLLAELAARPRWRGESR